MTLPTICAVCRHRHPPPGRSVCLTCVPMNEGERETVQVRLDLDAATAKVLELQRSVAWWQAVAEAKQEDRDRLREALTWAVGFIRCNLPRAAEQYPDMRNAEELIGDGGLYSGEFHRTCCRAEVAEHERDRYRAALELLSQIRHVSGSAQAAFRSNLRTVDAVLRGADVRNVETVEAIANGTWKPKEDRIP